MPDPVNRVILAIDAALSCCSVAVLEGEEVVAHLSEPMTRGHAERLAPMADEAMQAAGLPFAALDRIAVTTGPGSFTGLRVGLAFARALALALQRPCVGFSTLQVLALAEGSAGRRAAAIAAPAGVFFALYADGAPEVAPAWMTLAGACAHLDGAQLAGPGAVLLGAASPGVNPAAPVLARLAAHVDPALHPPQPLYLREPYAEAP